MLALFLPEHKKCVVQRVSLNTGCIKMIGSVSICLYGFENACISKFSHMERNSRCSRFVRMRNPTPLFSLSLGL